MYDWLSFEHIIWDWNGTLLNDLDLVVEITNDMLARRGRAAVNRDFYREQFGFPVMDFYRRMGFNFDTPANAGLYDQLVAEFSSAYESRCRSCRLHEGAAAVLGQIQDCNIGQSILSASDRDFLLETVQAFGIAGYFARISGLDDKRGGVKLNSGQELVTSLDLPGEKILLIGDTVHDCEVAAALGVQCLIILNGYNGPALFHNVAAPTLPALTALL